jgi:AbrB family looped-hinge helix DNA binding protein
MELPMRITTKGQVTIPARIREQAGLLPNTEVEFAYDGRGQVRLFPLRRKGGKKSRGEVLVEHMRGKGDIKMTTEQIMALTRGS